MSKTIAKLTRIQGRATAYEIVLEAPNGDRTLICYTARPGIASLLRNVAAVGPAIAAAANATDLEVDKRAKVVTLDSGYTVRYSGRTQRAAICEGEYAPLAS